MKIIFFTYKFVFIWLLILQLIQISKCDDNSTNTTINTNQANYPNDIFSYVMIKKGIFLIYFFGIMYCFLGISLVTQNFINPSIDIIKKKGVLSSDSMNATLLAMTNSAAESFIIMNSIFFGVSDIGISTIVQQTAFYSLVIQGAFYLIAETNTRVDWWIISRDTIFILIYLIVLTVFLIGNNVQLYKAIVLLVLYFVHILLMKFNYMYEIAIKKSVARSMEIKELKKICAKDISHFHRNLNTRALTIEMLNRVQYKVEDNLIVFDHFISKKIKPITCVKIREERYADFDNRQLMARATLKKAVIKILIKIQAYKMNEKIQRNEKSKISLQRIIKIEEDNDDRDFDESSMEDYENDPIESASGKGSSKGDKNKEQSQSAVRRHKTNGSGGADSQSNKSINQKQSPRGFTSAFNEEDLGSSAKTNLAQSSIYEMIHDTINKDAFSIKPPRQFKNILLYIFLIPLTHLQYYTIPNPMKKGKQNFYPLTLFLSIIWIWFYTWMIVWWTYSVTQAFGLHFSIIPMILYPFGISIRDRKKFVDFKLALKVFKEELQDQEISLAETYSGPVFQITGLLGIAWIANISTTGNPISFINESIQYQVPILLGVVTIKFLMLAIRKFKTKRSMFYFNVGLYLAFLLIVGIIDYRKKIEGQE